MLKTLRGFAHFALVACGVVLLAQGAADGYAAGVAAGLIAIVGGLILAVIADQAEG